MKLIFTAFFFIVLSVATYGQCVATDADPCVSVKQSTLDRMAQALDRLKAAEVLIAAFEKERSFTDAERKAWLGFKDAAESTVAMLQKGIADRDKVIDSAMKVIDKLMAVNDKLLIQLDKKPSLWSKFLNTVKTIITLVVGIKIGQSGF